MEEILRERAISSEPRRNPFEDSNSRKRQRVSSGGSRSRSVDTAVDSDTPSDPMLLQKDNDRADAELPPSTPTQIRSEPSTPEPPTSSRVTINLRTSRHLEPIPSSPSSPSPPSPPSRMFNNGEEAGTRMSIESESDALSATPATETPSSTPSVSGSPRVEVVTIEDEDSDFVDREPQVAILDDDDDSAFLDPLSHFPYWSEGETLVSTIARLGRFLQYDAVENDESFCKLRDWISTYLSAYVDTEAFYESYSHNREFWAAIPDLIWALNYRSRFFGDFLRRNMDSRQALTDMLCQFARLAGRFLAMDTKVLSNYERNPSRSRDPDLGSRAYLQAFAYLLRTQEGSHIGRNLDAHYQWDWDKDTEKLLALFQKEGGTIVNLTKLVGAQLPFLAHSPKTVEAFTDPCRIVSKIIEDVGSRLSPQYDIRREAQSFALITSGQEKMTYGYKFFKTMSDALDTIIEKHVTVLAPDAATSHLSCLTLILFECVRLENEAIRAVFEKYRQDNPTIPRKCFPKIMSTAWKFGVLKKLITSAQMQLRVIGVSTMCADLLDIYQKGRAPDPANSPYLLFFANFIIENQLVDYLVGIGSHPEIINESNNILGYLIVTKTYDSQLTDRIWATVTKSQDPRVVDAILRMIMRCLNLYDSRSLLYLCEKASELPIEAFTGVMREFCQLLFKELTNKPANESGYIDGQPYQLCVRLIRESSIVSKDSAGFVDVQNFAVPKFRELVIAGPSPEVKEAIYSDCVADIANKSNTAAGSICIINALARQYQNDLRTLISQHSLTKLIIEELEFTIKGDQYSDERTSKHTPTNLARRELLQAIIFQYPGSISANLGERLWDVLVGKESRTVLERSHGWSILVGVVRKTPTNVYLASCFRDYLPHLPPSCFTTGTLDFVKEAILSWSRSIDSAASEEDQAFASPALEQLWRMILTAPQNTIDAAAINLLVEVYVDFEPILAMPRSRAKDIHLALVDRCLDQLKGAAAKLKDFNDGSSSGSEEGMVIVPSDDQFHEQEMTFARSLAVLREFLRSYHGKPHFAPLKPKPEIAPASSPVEGEPFIIKYQIFDGNKQTEIQQLTIGKANTVRNLFASFYKVTGFKRLNMYCGGRLINIDALDVDQSLEDLKLNTLVLVRRQPDEVDGANNNNITLEVEIMKHFDELWSYLSMHDKVAQEIYYFLIQFPVYEQLLNSFEADTPYSEIFPLGQPYKSLYAIYSLRQYLTAQSAKTGAVDEKALIRAISLIVSAISDRDVLDHCAHDHMRVMLATQLVESLMTFLKQPLLPSSVSDQLNEVLLERLLELIYAANGVEGFQYSQNLTSQSFETILEACGHNPSFWRSFIAHLKASSLLGDLLLRDPRPIVRKGAAKQIINKCTFSPSLAQVTTRDFVVELWPMVAGLIAEGVLQPQLCEETFHVAEALFKRLAEISTGDLQLDSLVSEWATLLLSHACTENVYHPENIDLVVKGLGILLYCATSYAKVSVKPLMCGELGTRLFQAHLFPELSSEDELGGLIVPKTPLLYPASRSTLCDTIFQLVKDDKEQYRVLVDELSALVTHSPHDEVPYAYELNFNFERHKSIRSSTGYVGLRNLSNTCYLNSLFTQLFMNVTFRKFMLNANVADGGASQKLLSETQNLFGYMQNSLRRFVDPINLAGSIRTYEETQIDVTIQMDVDEFYNLLFDRWESQILLPEEKRKFRSFYGGQLVQQVKSKECSHISERLEPFSAIQCDIKGKSCLQESLQAYVDGEIMEGDNKYKCSTCDRHVDAVKRACLKDIPDNLIFHLKRFDFNLRTLMRSKINDHFSFPTKIDMRPYKVEHLMDNPEETPEDVFELVGILVHSGTAESGHYYSFIRERPSTEDKESWVEFNDDVVSPWDPNQMENACFGGPDFRSSIENTQYDKVWSAYMLFYQRSSVLAAQKQELRQTNTRSPVRLAVPPRLSNHIAMENELLMRKYCLYDSSHATLVSRMLANLKQINGGRCSTSHVLEKHTLLCALNTLDQVVARTKDLPDFPVFMMTIRQACNNCPECSRDYLEWFCDCPEALRALLLRNSDANVRHEIGTSILDALRKVKAEASYAYGLGEDDDSIDELDGGDPRLIQRIIQALGKLWDMFHNSTRAWPEYFSVLSSIASLGRREATLLLDNGYLQKTLEIVSADPLLPLSPQLQRMLTIISKRLTTRPVSYEVVIELLAKLLETCEIRLESVDDDEERFDLAIGEKRIPLTGTERHLLMQHWTRSQVHILTEKLLQINQNWDATGVILVTLMKWPDSLDCYVLQAIMHGLKRGGNSLPAGPYLKAAMLYCTHSDSPKAIPQMLTQVAKAASHLDTADGRDFLEFFKDIYDLAASVEGIDPKEFQRLYVENIKNWAPALLTHYESDVRRGTENFLRQLIINHEEIADVQERATVIKRMALGLGIACMEFLHETYIRPRHQAVREVLMSINAVIEACCYYCEEDDKSREANRFKELIQSVIPALKKYEVDEADEEVSDWEGSEGEYDGSSEPMDSTTEFCGTADEDPPL